MSKLKGFISYAHKDEDYFQPIKDGLKAHGKHSKVIDSTLDIIYKYSLWISIKKHRLI